MSSTTVSSVNKYLLGNNKAPVVNTQLATNQTFPDNFNGLIALFKTNALIQYHDCRYTFSVSGDGDSYKNVSNGYELLVSSYKKSLHSYNTKNSCPGTMLYNTDPQDGTYFRWWQNNDPYHSNLSLVNYLDGVSIGNPNTDGMYRGTGNVYSGGGVGHFYTTIYDSGSVNGEFFQQKFPFKARLINVQFMCRTNSGNRGPKLVRLLGSDDGSTWNYIDDITYGTYTNSTYNVGNVTTTKRFSYIRCVILSTIGDSHLNIQQMRWNFDTWTLQSGTE